MADAKKTAPKKSKLTTPTDDVLVDQVVTEEAAEVLNAKAAAKNSKAPKEEIIDGNNQEDNSDADETTEQRGKVAKAGKRSAKALDEAAAKEAKEDRKATEGDDVEKPKQHSNPTRTRLERQGKKFQAAAAQVEVDKLYSLEEAVALIGKTSPVKFDATVELHINLNVDPRHADQNIRDNLVLPAGTGKSIKIAVLTEDVKVATDAGADIAGTDEFLKELEKGNFNFDILIATPALMPRLGKYARTLGPRGLMPNPKSGTVTNDIAKAVSEAKAGRVEYRVDTTGIVHLGAGKVSFTAAQLLQNVQAILTSIKANKPASVKSTYFKAIYLSTSMGPSILVDLASVN